MTMTTRAMRGTWEASICGSRRKKSTLAFEPAENWLACHRQSDHFGMRIAALAAARALAVTSALGGCISLAPRIDPASPTLPTRPAFDPPIRTVSAPPIRTVSAPTIRVVSARDVKLPSIPLTTGADRPSLREPADLRTRVGMRDKRDAAVIVLGWLSDLGITVQARDIPSLVTWAQSTDRLHAATETPMPGDVLVFDRTLSDDPSDLIALAIARDARGVIEFAYAGGGVIRRGFYDPLRPRTRRDDAGAIVNTFLRHTKRMPPKGTKYLASELLSHVIHLR
jgi:hypothetical protein